MNAKRKNLLPFLGIGLTLAGLVGCGNPQKEALRNVEKKGYELTVADLHAAAAAGDIEGLELFEAAGLAVDSKDPKGQTALMKAGEAGNLAVVEKLLGMGADPRLLDARGRDAMIIASGKGHTELVRMLLARGADKKVRDTEGWGALSLASYHGHVDTVVLLGSTASPSELDDALLVASFGKSADVVNALLNQGANINSRSPKSKTPLMIASEAGRTEIVRVLLQNQANPYAVDRENLTAANLAVNAGHPEIGELINQPDQWGTSPQGETVAGEMKDARNALVSQGVEETLEVPSEDGSPSTPPATRPAPAAAAGQTTLASTQSGASQSPVPVPSTPPATRAATVPAVAVAAPAATHLPADSIAKTPASTSSTAPALHATPVTAPVARTAQQIKEESRSKPIVALNGSTIHARSPEQAPVKSMVLAAYHEESLPIVVEQVDGTTASVRRLDQTVPSQAVEKGQQVPGTPYVVKEVSSRYIDSKEGKGRMVDVSRVIVEDTSRGSTHLLVKDASGQTSDSYAILTAPDSRYRYVVKTGDVFRTTQPDLGAKDYQVLEIRASAVVIKDLASGEITTVARDGVVAP